MSETQSVKVYELAKELGMDSLSLVDKLKGLKINVKNHMSELGADDARAARSALKKPSAADTAKPVKKKAATTRKKASTTEAATVAGPATVAEGSSGKSASPIIRRRVKADGATETVSSRATAAAEEHPVESLQETPETYAEEPVETAAESVEGTEEEAIDAEADEIAAGSSTQEEREAPAARAQGTGASAAGAPTTAGTAAGDGATSAGAGTGRPAIVLPPRPVAPRRSILKIVEPAAPPPRPVVKAAPAISPVTPKQPGIRGTSTQDKDGFRIIKMTKENLDQMVEEEAAKKRGGGREHEIRPEDVRFADYRKKEMVFLPRRKKIPVGKQVAKTKLTTSGQKKRVVQMGETITVGDFADQLSVKANDVIRKLMAMGQMVTLNQSIDLDTAILVAAEYKFEVKDIAFKEDEFIPTKDDGEEVLATRPPIVTIMGHVDHGKTTLLDTIREANVAGGEAGGITQHIGAYTVEKNGKLITFIDTPGHEAFTVMRARGANVTDIVILVVSADDGVMPQTREALSHAQAAKVPIIVAVNKIDKPGANPEKIKQGLAELNLLAEDWGGETQFVQVSALKKTNIDKLLEAILLQAEMLDLKANAAPAASGTVLEARLERGRGPVASVLVKRGTLRVGDPIVSGVHSGRVKALMNDKGEQVKEVTPGLAVEVLGFEGLPNAGEVFDATTDEAGARDIAQHRTDQIRAKTSGKTSVTLDDLFSKIQAGDMKELNVILKADVFGSCEAIRDSLLKLSNEKVKVKVLLSAPGGITESDVLLASASSAIIIGFNVRPETKARQLAVSEHVDIRSYQIIYELLDDVKKAMTGLLDKLKVEKFLGRAEVRQTFTVPKIGMVAGTAVVDGKIVRGAFVRLLRDSRVIYEGKMSSLRRFKDDAKEVATGFECGIGLENYNDLKIGDIIEAYQIEMVAPTMDA